MKELSVNDSGRIVEDAQQCLRVLGFYGGDKPIDGLFGNEMLESVRAFRAAYGLTANDMIDRSAWAVLNSVVFSLGSRSLYLRMPNFAGPDVAELQRILNTLGFSCGEADGLYSTRTERAVQDFQLNMGLRPDGIAGQATYEAISRLHHMWKGKNDTAVFPCAVGYTRAAEVLERTEICFYGVNDESASRIAARISNLALATTEASKICSADTMYNAPTDETIFVQLSTVPLNNDEALTVRDLNDMTLSARIRACVLNSREMPRRLFVEILAIDPNDVALLGRGEQRAATQLLDSFCRAFEEAL